MTNENLKRVHPDVAVPRFAACGIASCALGTFFRAVAAVAFATIASNPAEARDFGRYGGYIVTAIETTSKSDRGACLMTKVFDGPGDSTLTIMRSVSYPDEITATLGNHLWSAKEGESYDNIVYSFDSGGYQRSAIGIELEGQKGFLSIFPAGNFISIFSRSTSLRVAKDGVEIDRLSMAGSAVATEAFNRCWTYLVADDRIKEREWKKWEDLPLDPFKVTPTPPAKDHS